MSYSFISFIGMDSDYIEGDPVRGYFVFESLEEVQQAARDALYKANWDVVCIYKITEDSHIRRLVERMVKTVEGRMEYKLENSSG